MTHLIRGAEANETLDIHSWESLNEKYNKQTNTEIGRIKTQPRKKRPFTSEEYEDLVNHIPNTWKETIKNTRETKKKHPTKTLPELLQTLKPMKGTWVRNKNGKIGIIEDGAPRAPHAFSGKAGRHEGLAQLLLKDNTQCQEIDTVIHASRHDLLCDVIYQRTLRRAPY